MRKINVIAVILTVLSAATGCRPGATMILIRSIPDQARVTDDGLRDLGTTNLEIRAPEGSMISLIVSKPGYRDKRITRKAEGGRMVIDALLIPVQQTAVRVELVPPHARFSLFTKSGRPLLEGKMADDYPLIEGALWQGAPNAACRIEASAPGYRAISQEVVLVQDMENRLSLVLNELETTLAFTSEPSGAEVTEKSLGLLGRTPFSRTVSIRRLIESGHILAMDREPVASLLLTFRKAGFEPQSKTVSVDLRSEETAVGVRMNPIK